MFLENGQGKTGAQLDHKPKIDQSIRTRSMGNDLEQLLPRSGCFGKDQ
jgi:hypothetical protein